MGFLQLVFTGGDGNRVIALQIVTAH